MARSIKNPSQEDNMGLTYGSRCEHGVHKRRAPDGSTSFNNRNLYLKGAAEMYENGVFTVDLKFIVDSHLQYASLKMSNLMEDISASPRHQLQQRCH